MSERVTDSASIETPAFTATVRRNRIRGISARASIRRRLIWAIPSGGGWTNAQLFWIVKNGVKMTGMAPYGESLKDDEIWNVIAFVRKLPELTQAQYRQMEKDVPGYTETLLEGRLTLWYLRDDGQALPHTPHWRSPLSKYWVTGWQYRAACPTRVAERSTG